MVDGARIEALSGALALAGAGAARAQESDAGRRTLRLDPAAVPGPATLADAAWLVGAWRGEGLGGAVQEVWGEPVAGRMVGTFTSLHMAAQEGIDPGPVPVLDWMKHELRN